MIFLRHGRPSCTWLSLVIFNLAGASTAAAQRPTVTHELRVDAIVAHNSAIEGGASLIVPAGVYARTAVTAAGGMAERESAAKGVGRLEVVSRFLLDPFRDWPYGLSIGAGVGVTNLADGRRWRPYLASVLDLETKRVGKLSPALQVGLGGGVRLGIALRSGTERWR
jgi:hypothetical protein